MLYPRVSHCIVAHESTCAIIVNGPVTFRVLTRNEVEFNGQITHVESGDQVATICTCGGVVLEWTLDSRGDWRWMSRKTEEVTDA